MAATRLSQYQDAIRLFGDARLDLITDDVESRRALDDAWTGSVEFCLRAAAWRYALAETPLQIEDPSSQPLPGFSTTYFRPLFWLRTHALFVLNGALARPVDARELGSRIYANDDNVIIRYVSMAYSDPQRADSPWPEHFAKAQAAHLAFQVADRLTNSAAAGVRLSQLFGSLMQEAILHDALPEDPWLRFQLDGSFQKGLLYVLEQGYWIHALKTVEVTAAPITAPPATTPIIGYPYSYPLPADFLHTHAWFVPAGDGREYPIDIKEDGKQWSTTAQYFAVRYVSSEFGLDPQRWPEPFLVTVQSYLQLAEMPDVSQQTSRTTGQPVPAAATFRNVLQAALVSNGEQDNPWYRFQRTGAFLRACFHVAETGRWKFAIDTLNLEADAWIEQEDVTLGTLPANVHGDGSISPSYSAVFAKPADWLRTIWVYRIDPHSTLNVNTEGWPGREPVDYRDEKGNWHANWQHIQVRYIRRAAIESWRWPQSYADAVLAWLEYEEARIDPKLTQLAAAKQRIYEDMVDKAAKSDDSQEFPPYRTVGRLVRGRFSSSRHIGAQGLSRF
jgi:hypothetical protein